MKIFSNKAQAEGFWRIIIFIIAFALLFWMIFYYSGLKDKSVELIGKFFGGLFR